MEASRYSTAIFLDISQAFDKFWHHGLLHKIKISFPTDLYAIIRSYLLYKTFKVKYEEIVNQLEINSGVPQGNVLRRVLYLLYTADFSSYTIATYADDAAVLVAHNNHLQTFF
jgi:transcription initiation factor IIE alpha subunit